MYDIAHPAALGGYSLIVNIVNYLVCWDNKRRSISSEWRVPEKRLLTLAVMGGWPAAKLTQRVLHHKTRKQPFATYLNLIGVIRACALAFGGGAELIV